MKTHFKSLAALAVLGFSTLIANAQTPAPAPHKPTLFLIGDSTVKNGRDTGSGNQWGWGHILPAYFDPAKITVENDAVGGTSSRSFMESPNMWPKVLAKLQPGDFVLMQFGTNDDTRPPETDNFRFRSTIKGNGDETVQGPITADKMETIHSYGWYMRQFVAQTKAKGATPILCSMVPHNSWTGGKMNRQANTYELWTKQAADQSGAAFIPLNALAAAAYEKLGQEGTNKLFPTAAEHTHTDWDGAVVLAQCVVQGIKEIPDSPLIPYLAPKPAELKNPNPPAPTTTPK